MQRQEKKLLEILEKDGVASLATYGPEGVHLVATWNRFLLVRDNVVLIPAGGYKKTQRNVESGSDIKLLVGSSEVEGKNGSGSGYRLTAHAEFHKEGPHFDTIKQKFPWARAALVLDVQGIERLM